MSQLALYLFGPPRLEVDGAPVHISRRKAMALLAYLAVTGQSHSRDSLATLLWPENDQSSARGGLRRMLSEIRGALGDGWLVTDWETARLNRQNDFSAGKSLWLDVIAFDEKIKLCDSHKHPPTVTCPDCLPAIEEAIELYQDDFMAGFSLKDCPAYDEWQFFQGEEMRRQLVNALVRLSFHNANALEFETAIHYARRWLALDPLHEPAHRHLMALYDQSRQRSAALRQYQICRETLSEELGAQPSEETKDLYQKIQASTVAASRDLRIKSNLPVQATPFIGRINELAEIRAKLKKIDCRLLTLLGPGGSGKTRLAIEAGGQLLDVFKHGVFFVNLTPLQEVDKFPSSIARALRFQFSREGTPEEQLLDYLRNKQMLIILDNFEHLLDGAGFANQIMSAAPGIKILVTSRVRLMITGEHLYDVWGMAYPESSVSLETASHQYSAIRLFESEASRVQGDFKLADEHLSDVIQVCSLLEGMPLGIVLAASWVRMLTPAEIADEIARDLEFLEADMQDLPRRQHSLRSVFNHSWRLLGQDEREIMSALSVFRGGFTREAAQMVTRASLGNLMGLIDQSTLHRVADGRFEMHELLRQYAAEKLAMDPAAEADTRWKHSETFCQVLAVWERALQGSQQGDARKEMVLEIDNIRAAWKWAVEKLAIKSLMGGINGLCIFYARNLQHLEAESICLSLVERLEALSASEQPKVDSDEKCRTERIELLKLQVRALAWTGFLNSGLGNMDFAHKLIQKCLSTLESSELAEQDTRFEKALAYIALPYILKNMPSVETIQLAEEGLHLFKSLDEPWWVGLVLSSLGHLANSVNEVDKRKLYREESLVVRRKLGDLRGIADSLVHLAWDATGEKAEEMLYEALAISLGLDDRHNVVFAYVGLGWHWTWQGRFREARSLYHETLATYDDLDFTQSVATSIHSDRGFPDLYLGRYESAQNLAEYAVALLKEAKFYYATFYAGSALGILGGVALVEGSYVKAERRFNECLLVFQSYEHPESINRTLNGLGFAARGLNQTPLAQGYFCEALHVAVNIRFYVALAYTLPGIALLLADQGDVEWAVELYALASTYGIVANSKWFDDIAGNQIATVAEGLPVEVVEAAKARGRALDLWETAAELLVELDALGWVKQPSP